ncbi:MAG: serine hydrolase domain-containing protein [Candidatus Binataceae bacterium]
MQISKRSSECRSADGAESWKNSRRRRALLIAIAIVIVFCAAGSAAWANSTSATIKRIAKTYARDSIQTGGSIGIEIGVVYGAEPPLFVSAGDAIAGRRPFTPNTIFQIGSVSKVFTTNLLGQSVANGSLQLSMPLSSFENEIGPLEPLTAKITLEELGDFTGGFPTLAEACGTPPIPGCLPSSRPAIGTYTAQDFAEYFQTALPMNFFNNPPTQVSTLPAPYNYSDYSIGLLGLLLGDQSNAPLSNDALTGWFNAVANQILTPLAMKSTFLFGPRGARIANGYEPALANASVANGEISAVSVTSPGGLYASAPRARITGGGGHGARLASAIDGNGRVSSIAVVNPGAGYIAPASVIFTGGGSSTTANGAVIVKNGKVAAIKIIGAGAGYARVPTVTITGGRKTKGTDATAVAHLAGGSLSYVEVTSGGSGYVPPLAVIVAPGSETINNIPIWAPAGALSSSMRDMLGFAAAALGNTTIAKIAVPAAVTNGFAIAETPYACSAEDPLLADCPAATAQSALSWSITPAATGDGVPEIVGKNGGISGFSTQVLLMPSQNLAVVVFANSRQNVPDTESSTAEADRVARNILFALFYNLP